MSSLVIHIYNKPPSENKIFLELIYFEVGRSCADKTGSQAMATPIFVNVYVKFC